MTVYAWARKRRFPNLPEAVPRYFDVAHETRVLARCHWQRDATTRPTLILLHGLEASSEAHYMCGLAEKGFAAGFNTLRLNQRNCGGTEALSRGLYHSGLTEDVQFVMKELSERDGLETFAVAGYSLGGNVALKLAGDYGARPPASLIGVAAVSPIIEVGLCVRALEQWRNTIYQWNFVKDLKRRMRRKAVTHPGVYPIDRLSSVRTVRQFDEVFTAPHFGFRDADDYYHRVSAMRVVDRISVPTLIITAEDDPFVPVDPFRDPAVRANPFITLLVTAFGGHCAFVAEAANGDDGYWAERRVVDFFTPAV